MHLGSVELCLHTGTGVLGKEIVEKSQEDTDGNTKALGTERTCSSFVLPHLTLYLPSASLLQSTFLLQTVLATSAYSPRCLSLFLCSSAFLVLAWLSSTHSLAELLLRLLTPVLTMARAIPLPVLTSHSIAAAGSHAMASTLLRRPQ